MPSCVLAELELGGGEDHPVGGDPAQLRLAQLLAARHPRPGQRHATVWPAATLGAPQTIVRSPSPVVDLADAQPVGVGVLLGARAPCRRRSSRPRGGPTTPTRSTSVPVIASRSASSSGLEPGVAVLAQPGVRDPHRELLQHPHVVVEEAPQVGDAVPQHRDPLDPDAEGEALDPLGVVAVLGDEAEHVGVDHAGAEDLDPALALAEVAALAAGQRAGAAALEAGDVDLDAGLGEGEEVRPQAHLAVGAEDRPAASPAACPGGRRG